MKDAILFLYEYNQILVNVYSHMQNQRPHFGTDTIIFSFYFRKHVYITPTFLGTSV